MNESQATFPYYLPYQLLLLLYFNSLVAIKLTVPGFLFQFHSLSHSLFHPWDEDGSRNQTATIIRLPSAGYKINHVTTAMEDCVPRKITSPYIIQLQNNIIGAAIPVSQ